MDHTELALKRRSNGPYAKKNVERTFRELGRSHGRLPQNALKVVTRLDDALMVYASALLRGFTPTQTDTRAVCQPRY